MSWSSNSRVPADMTAFDRLSSVQLNPREANEMSAEVLCEDCVESSFCDYQLSLERNLNETRRKLALADQALVAEIKRRAAEFVLASYDVPSCRVHMVPPSADVWESLCSLAAHSASSVVKPYSRSPYDGTFESIQTAIESLISQTTAQLSDAACSRGDSHIKAELEYWVSAWDMLKAAAELAAVRRGDQTGREEDLLAEMRRLPCLTDMEFDLRKWTVALARARIEEVKFLTSPCGVYNGEVSRNGSWDPDLTDMLGSNADHDRVLAEITDFYNEVVDSVPDRASDEDSNLYQRRLRRALTELEATFRDKITAWRSSRAKIDTLT